MNDKPAPLPTSTPPPAPKRSPLLLYGCGGMIALILIIVATVACTLWWVQRPITPVVLSAPEKAAVDEKLQSVAGAQAPAAPPGHPQQEPDRAYVPGSKLLKLTERELNGLLNTHTDLGNSVRLELGRNAVNAYVTVPIPADFPIGGGRTFRARARLALALGEGGAPHVGVEDVTVFGLSLPKAWLAGLSGENLFQEFTGHRDGHAVVHGIKSLRVEPGVLILKLAD